MYAGMRLGELRALRVESDRPRPQAHQGPTPAGTNTRAKSTPRPKKAGATTVVIKLLEDSTRSGIASRTGRSRLATSCSGKTADQPFCPGTIHKQSKATGVEGSSGSTRTKRASSPRTNASGRLACTTPGTPPSRTCSTLGITIDKVSKFMGHASISTVTIDRYGHLLPGGEAEAAEILRNEYHAPAPPRR